MPMRVVRFINREGHDHPFLMSLIVMLLIVIPGFARLNSLSETNHRLASCVDSWANGYQDRTTALTKASIARSDALDSLVRSINTQTEPKVFVDLRAYIIAPTPSTQQAALVKLLGDAQSGNSKFRTSLDNYIRESDRFNQVSSDYPIEALAQKLNC